jgi:hypothetical protein
LFWFILISLKMGAKRGCGALQLGKHAAEPGLEAAPFARGELWGNDKALQAQQGLVDVLKTLFQCSGGR